MAPSDSNSILWKVRPFHPMDQPRVRSLAVDTADCGNPSPGLFGDRDLLADWLTNYYLEMEPESSFVAVDGDKVVGYLTGCLNSSRYNRAMIAVGTKGLWRSMKRGTFFRRTTWTTLRRALEVSRQTIPYTTRDTLKRYPSHFHLNITPGYRGQGIGKALLHTFLTHAQSAGVRGIHLGSRADNPFRSFFERMGFREAGRGRLPSWSPDGPAIHDVVLYVKDLPR